MCKALMRNDVAVIQSFRAVRKMGKRFCSCLWLWFEQTRLLCVISDECLLSCNITLDAVLLISFSSTVASGILIVCLAMLAPFVRPLLLLGLT